MDTKVLIKQRNRGVIMSKIPNGRSTKEFREEAVKMAVAGGHPAGSAARRLSLPTSALENWVRAYRPGKLGNIGKQAKPLTETEQELARVKRELAEVMMERDI